MKKHLGIAVVCLLSAGIAFGAVVGVAAATDGDGSSAPQGQQGITPQQDRVRQMATADQIPVVDSKGAVRGTVNKSDLYEGDGLQAKEGSLFVPVHDDSGAVVGYYGNFAGFVEKDVAEQPGFDPLTYARDQGRIPEGLDVG